MEDFVTVSQLPFGFKVGDEAVVETTDFGETGLHTGLAREDWEDWGGLGGRGSRPLGLSTHYYGVALTARKAHCSFLIGLLD